MCKIHYRHLGGLEHFHYGGLRGKARALTAVEWEEIHHDGHDEHDGGGRCGGRGGDGGDHRDGHDGEGFTTEGTEGTEKEGGFNHKDTKTRMWEG